LTIEKNKKRESVTHVRTRKDTVPKDASDVHRSPMAQLDVRTRKVRGLGDVRLMDGRRGDNNHMDETKTTTISR
jgi:hypothetical protein